MKAFLGGLVLLAGMTAARADTALVDAAKKEGSIVWYSGMIVNQIVRPIVDAFEAKYPGIKVQASRATGNDNALQVLKDSRAHRPLADVVDSTTALTPLLAAGLVAEFRP